MKRWLTLAFSAFLLFQFSCTYTQKVKDGRFAFERKQYSKAITLLQREYKKAKTRREKGELAYFIGESYRHTNNLDDAIDWYRIAYDNSYGVDALKQYAYALKANEQYEEAMQAFKDLGIEIGSPYEYRREIAACKVALGWLGEKRREFSAFPADFSSSAADYAPVRFEDRYLVFTSDRPAATGDDTYNWTGREFSDLFKVDLQTGIVEPFDPLLNTEFNEGTATFNSDFTEVIFTRCYGDKKADDYCKLMMSRRIGEAWSAPVVLDFVQDNVNYGHPALSPDGSMLYFSCNSKDGWGGYDIWFSERTPQGWSEPQLLSRTVNTPGNEMFPVVDADTLYFSSDYHPGMGGLDIFKTYRLPNGAWTPVKNLKPPINSGADDFALVIDYQAKREPGVLQVGYFSSNRPGGPGSDDIYRFERRQPPPKPEEPPQEIVYRLLLEGFVLEKIFEEADNPDSRVLGRKPLPGAKVTATFNGQTQTFTVGEDGRFSLELELDTDYRFTAEREGYLSNEATFSTRGIGLDPETPEQTFELEIVLDKIFLQREIVLEDIYYDFDKWDIREDAKPTLDKLARTLQLNPDIRIQLASHTDCRGTDRYNLELSQKRAQAAVDYLIAKGISPERLIAKGYGESQLRVNCVCSRCTEEEHQLNRRTTFTILEDGSQGLER